MSQLALFEPIGAPGEGISGLPKGRPCIARTDPLPPGPYSVGLTKIQHADGYYEGQPYTIVCGDGRAIAGHVDSAACAEAIARAMNETFDRATAGFSDNLGSASNTDESRASGTREAAE